ncbi:hypothetical protein CEUSTIGMA_g5593.t1 [Chlamydomonas eustigma]|uniref:Tubulin/FtsZ GTPase domain-containing protein n=1 Tax=Chlamydomonas eustigma TaxID=1157962 RepID=A0A250X506_9CHLO|nr:hypothetical protein CEUSTIGMA_g5593.t1 [Chlamydomonas eustigma]|eukprot:GAX78151.1 hypothetical protein CEUSTIGMA_g5593.t1 [Chlamydomonas eustigma]
MPVVTLQVGQCGNQLGQALWDALDAQCNASTTTRSSDSDLKEASYFFKHDADGQRKARCLLIDTEPKVVHAVLNHDAQGLFSRRRCFLGHSGRGNNWAYGYSQMFTGRTDGGKSHLKSQSAAAAGIPSASGAALHSAPWNNSALVEEPGKEEFHILEQVVEGIRKECEECDGAADFLMLHSLGGGSGSGLGSRLLEHLREEYPLHNIATVSVAPRAAGDSPMQSLNSVLALSFLQAYSDSVMLFNNQDMIEAAGRGDKTGTASLEDVNSHISKAVMGALWPLNPREAHSGVSRIRDMVATVSPDVCCKIVEARTSAVHTSDSLDYREACKSVQRQFSRFDKLDCDRPVTSSDSLLIARGLQAAPPPRFAQASASTNSSPSACGTGQETVLASTYIKACGGVSAFAGGGMYQTDVDCLDCVKVRTGPALKAVPASNSSSRKLNADSKRIAGGNPSGYSAASSASVTVIANRSSVIGQLADTLDRATSIWRAGAYLHWYERCGCSKESIRTAIEQVSDVAECYRSVHGIQDWLEAGDD